MDLKSKALVVIEYIALHNDIPEMESVYTAAHVANGHCENPHEEWLEWLNDCYDELVASGNFKPDSHLTRAVPDVAITCANCGEYHSIYLTCKGGKQEAATQVS